MKRIIACLKNGKTAIENRIKVHFARCNYHDYCCTIIVQQLSLHNNCECIILLQASVSAIFDGTAFMWQNYLKDGIVLRGNGFEQTK